MQFKFKTNLVHENVHVSGFKVSEKSEIESMSACVSWSLQMIVDVQGVISYDFLIDEIILKVVLHTHQDDDEQPVFETVVSEVLEIPGNQNLTVSKTDVNQSISLTSIHYVFHDAFPNFLNTQISM